MNGWTKPQEELMAKWADVAACYRWLHDRAEKKYSRLSMCINIPVIILSTITGAANFAVGSFIPPDDVGLKNIVAAGLGALSIGAGIITTLGNFFQYAQKSESNRVAGIAWGKFQRLVSVELAINPNDRIEALDFLQICRQDLDRLIEQSPQISDDVIKMFEDEFKETPNLKMPDICHGIEHTRVYDASKPRLGQLAAEATLHLRYKKNILAKSVMPEINKTIEDELKTRIEKRIRELLPAAAATAATAAATAAPPPDVTALPMETDWRRLLVGKKHLLAHHAAEVANNTVAIQRPLREVRPEEVRINIVGTDGPITVTPAIPNSVDGGSVAGSHMDMGGEDTPPVPMYQPKAIVPVAVAVAPASVAGSVRSSASTLGPGPAPGPASVAGSVRSSASKSAPVAASVTSTPPVQPPLPSSSPASVASRAASVAPPVADADAEAVTDLSGSLTTDLSGTTDSVISNQDGGSEQQRSDNFECSFG